MVAEGRTSGLNIRGKFGAIKRFFGWRSILLRNDVVDRLFHLLLFFIILQKYN